MSPICFLCLLLVSILTTEAARCQPGATGPCPTFTNLTVGTNPTCPTGGLQFTCTSGAIGYACNGNQGPRGPLPAIQSLTNNTSCSLLIGDAGASLRICNGSQGLQVSIVYYLFYIC